MFTVSKNILVTGSSGFIGFNLSKRLLNEGHNVTGIDSFNEAYDPSFKRIRQQLLKKDPNFKDYELNLDIYKNLENIKDTEDVNYDIVFHLAARAGVRQSFLDPVSYIKDNAIATTNVANFVKECEIKKLVFLLFLRGIKAHSRLAQRRLKHLVRHDIKRLLPVAITVLTHFNTERVAQRTTCNDRGNVTPDTGQRLHHRQQIGGDMIG